MADELDDLENDGGDGTQDDGGQGNETPPAPQTQGKRTPPTRERELPEDPDELKRELQRTRDALKRANQEATERRRKLDEIEDRERKAKEKDLTDGQRLQKQLADERRAKAEAERELADARELLVRTRIDTQVEREAQALDFEYPDIAPSLIDRGEVEYDPETGRVDGVKKALERLLKAKPGLAKSYSGGGTPPRQNPRQPPFGGRGGDGNQGQQQPSIHQQLAAEGGYAF
jgi:hypothetical protein